MRKEESLSINAREITARMDVKQTTRDTYNRALKVYASWLREENRRGDRADILAYKEQCLGQGKSPATVNGYLSAIRAAWAASGAPINPAQGIKPARQKRQFKGHLSQAQAQALLDVAREQGARSYAVVSILLHTGLRAAELASAQVGDISRRNGVDLLAVKGKGRDAKDDYVILSPRCLYALQTYLAGRRISSSSPLIASEGKGREGKAITPRAVRDIVTSCLEQAGLQDFSTHSLRHTAAVQMLLAGVPMEQVQRVLRHASASTTAIYTASIMDDIRLAKRVEYALDNIF